MPDIERFLSGRFAARISNPGMRKTVQSIVEFFSISKLIVRICVTVSKAHENHGKGGLNLLITNLLNSRVGKKSKIEFKKSVSIRERGRTYGS